MTVKRMAIAMAIMFVTVCAAGAFTEESPSADWDALMDVAYKITWYPRESLLEFMESKTAEYGQSLDEYASLLLNELAPDRTGGNTVKAGALAEGKYWKKYNRLASAQFCLYLAGGNTHHLENAKSALSVLSDKKELSDVAFWDQFYKAHTHLAAKDRNAFVKSVFDIWQNVILKLEAEETLTSASFANSLPHLYENMVNLIVARGIRDFRIPDLHPLSVIVSNLGDKLTSGTGYKPYVSAIVERMSGLKSDNFNLNFAVAFVEATAGQHEFEDEKSQGMVASKYENAKDYYELAYSWAISEKGRAAILTQYMGFVNYGIRRLIDKDPLLGEKPVFMNLPVLGEKLTDDALALYHELAGSKIRMGGWEHRGFKSDGNYLKAMRLLWDSAARLMIMRSGYHKARLVPAMSETVRPIEKPLSDYIDLFEQYAVEDLKIIPDNAYFLAAFAAKELAGLYGKTSRFSSDIRENDLALAYRLQSVEIFPLDITGILQLAHQAKEEGRLGLYLKHAAAVGSRLSRSIVAGRTFTGIPDNHGRAISLVKKSIPTVISNGPMLVDFLKNSNDTEDVVVRKTLAMARVLNAIQNERSDEIVEGVLSAVAASDFSNPERSADDILKSSLPKDIYHRVSSVAGDRGGYFNPPALVNELYASLDNRMHTFLRTLYYEVSYRAHQYTAMKEKAMN